MSSQAVRQWFRERVQTQFPSVPYYDTINKTPDPKGLPDLWITLEFSNASETRLSLGRRALFRESGVVTVIFVGLSGRGDTAVVAAAEQARLVLTDVSAQIPVGVEIGTVRIDAPDPPNTDPTESGNWFLGSVSCVYTLDVVRGPLP